MKLHLKTRFWNETVILKKTKYVNGQTALLAFIEDQPPAKLSINIEHLPEGYTPGKHVLIKSWGEGEGVADALIKAGVLSEPIAYGCSGFVSDIPMCEILVNLETA